MAKPSPLQMQFWDDEAILFWEEVGPTMLEILFNGLKGGTELLPTGLRVLVDWDHINEDAIRWLKLYKDQIFDSITEFTRNKSVGIIEAWVRSGESLDMLEKSLDYLYDDSRAERIAVTTVTEMYSEGNQMAWESTGMVEGKKWQTAQDELVCPICLPLDGKVSDLDENGFTTEEGGIGIKGPPAHINCRCYLLPVVDLEKVRGEIAGAIEEA